MKKKFTSLVLLFMIILGKASSQSYDFSAITQMLNDSSSIYLDRIYVDVYQNDSLIYHYQSGWLQCNNVSLGQGSATKWISGAIMLRLAEKGWLSLDDSIGTYLPIFTQNGKGHITLRHAYSMSSGIFNPGNGTEYHRDPSFTLAESADSIAEYVDLLYPTGSMIAYDGSMMHAWGRAIEVIDSINGNDRDWRTIAKEEFLDIMDMDSTDYTDFYPNNPCVAGGIETTPCDYLKFLKMLANNGIYNGDTVLMQSSIDEMFADQTNSAPIFHTYWPHNHPDFPSTVDTMRYTFGAWWTELDNSGNIIQISSPGVYGHYPFYDRCRNIYGTFFCYIPVYLGMGTDMIPTYLRFLKIIREEIGSCNLNVGMDASFNNNTDVTVFPNPTQSYCTINYSKRLKQIRIFNTLGLLMKCFNPQLTNEFQYDLTSLSPGMYIIQIETEHGAILNKKILKQ